MLHVWPFVKKKKKIRKENLKENLFFFCKMKFWCEVKRQRVPSSVQNSDLISACNYTPFLNLFSPLSLDKHFSRTRSFTANLWNFSHLSTWFSPRRSSTRLSFYKRHHSFLFHQKLRIRAALAQHVRSALNHFKSYKCK